METYNTSFIHLDFAVALRCSNSESNSDCTLEVPGFCIEVTKMDLSTNEQIERRLDCMVKTRANVHFLTVAGGCGYETQIDNQLIKLKCCEEDFCNESELYQYVYYNDTINGNLNINKRNI